MPSPTLLHFQQVSRRARRATRMVEEEQLSQKPKKVNSEIRKQQNRIASRNYREKRKKKLQYLQRLVEEGSNDGQTPEPTQQPQQAHVSSQVSQNDKGLASPPFMLPSASGFVPLNSSGIPALDLAATSSSTTFDSHRLPTTQTYLPFGSSWNSQTYDSPSPSNTVYTPAWMNSIGGTPRPTPSPETFHFSAQASQAVFETTTDSYHCAGEVTPQAEHYALDSPYMSYNAPQSQAPSASSYFFHAPPHPFERFVFV
ncbi:hypothetical protein HBH98_044350 [Parastagonospora nodorum]|nr:hypothetical protein HBH46_165140 [Parastagonospora nodorum]KAH4130950.1 hypothetical protein HBH47_019730 [Parastagonospora nodorum]KAH4351317.1 hypothetical protein HBH98_044350 [Parastagonospora nodorum]KAH4363921.1 hypothetical protein HBH97_182720 [Parastagonospora nodorum]KAH4430181.1 hypothetical protein HBH99_016700 [Parastagonospora nodorum]